MRHSLALVLAIGLAVASVPPGLSRRDRGSEYDAIRLAWLRESRAQGLAEAEAAANPRDLVLRDRRGPRADRISSSGA